MAAPENAAARAAQTAGSVPRKEAPRGEAPREEVSRDEVPRKEAEAPGAETVRGEVPRKEAEAPGSETLRGEAPRDEAPRNGGRVGECVLCGCCLAVCPLLAATGREEFSPRAKAILAGSSKFMDVAFDDAAMAELAGLCLACGRCAAVCPQGVDVPGLVARLRAAHPNFRRWLWKQWITRLGPFWGLAARGAAVLPEAFTPAQFGLALKGLRGLRPGTGLAPWLRITRLPREEYAGKYGTRPVAVFDGCVGGGPRKRWGRVARRLLAGLGAEVVSVDFSCCASTLGVAGLPAEQAELRRRNVAAWRGAGRPLLATYCATCRKGLADYAAGSAEAGLFADAAERDAWVRSVIPLSVLLAGAEAEIEAGAPAAVIWHRPCHADPADADAVLLRGLLGGRLHAPEKGRCCGFGGIMQLGAPKLSGLVAADCWGALCAAAPAGEAPYVVTGCSGCVMQLSATAPAGARVGHWLEILAG